MPSFFSRYAHWLHLRWPAGRVERLPECDERGRTNVPGIYVVGDLTGIPLLKFSADSGTRAVREVAAELEKLPGETGESAACDLAIVGGGVSGIAAAMEAQKLGLKFVVLEAAHAFSTVANFPKGKPIFTYPTEMKPAGALHFSGEVKETLLAEMEAQRQAAGIEPVLARVDRIERVGDEFALHHDDGATTRERRVIVAIGRSGRFRQLGCRGEDLPKVFNRLHDPHEFAGKKMLVVGGGDSAIETALALASAGAEVTLSYRGKEFTRAKPENAGRLRALAEKSPKSLQLILGSEVESISPDVVTLRTSAGEPVRVMNEVVFAMLGREAPLDFFRRSGIRIRGEWTGKTWLGFLAFAVFCVWLYHWKAQRGPLAEFGRALPGYFSAALASLSAAAQDPRTIFGTLTVAAKQASFFYSLAYTALIVVFGVRRMACRRTPYVRWQTSALIAFQVLPLFLLPYLILPWLGANGVFDHGFGKWFADQFFPIPSYSPEREYWRAFGFILAWPLFIWNIFTDHPTAGWLVLSVVQTFVVIPLIVRRWGKGAYCGWICSCGALAETLGDTHRHKMPHGPAANRWNLTGQIILAVALLLLLLRVLGWVGLGFGNWLYYGLLSGWPVFNYAYLVDLWLAGVIGVAAYFWFSGRVWCRFACPLAALMHLYARFSRFRIFPEKKKCISCNVCTTVCHQGIDVMNFANQGAPMEDPQCVRCSACVQQCPTGVLSFGRLGDEGVPILDRLAASPVQMREASARP